jgi:hypothetical protein
VGFVARNGLNCNVSASGAGGGTVDFGIVKARVNFPIINSYPWSM